MSTKKALEPYPFGPVKRLVTGHDTQGNAIFWKEDNAPEMKILDASQSSTTLVSHFAVR